MKRSVLVTALALSQVTLVQVSTGAAQDQPGAMNQGQMSSNSIVTGTAPSTDPSIKPS